MLPVTRGYRADLEFHASALNRYALAVPRAIIVAGPNGAGKTTFAREFLPLEANCIQFVNADLIAAGISPFAPDTAEIAAGRASLARLRELSGEGSDFAIETTLSGNWLRKYIANWQLAGYSVELYYLRLDSSNQAVQRVRKRVEMGGHSIPEDVIRRRFARSQNLFEHQYKDLVDYWIEYDNSWPEPQLVKYGYKRS